jgi:hypothetical protein
MIDLQRGRYLEARGLCQDLLNLGEKLREGSEAPLARALCALSRYALSDRDAGEDGERARERLHQALMDLRLVDAKQRLSFVLMQAALVELGRDAAERASALAEEAAAVAEALGRPSDVARAHAIAARCAQAALHPATFERHLAALRRVTRETLSAPARDEIDRVLAAAPATVSPMQERLHHDLRGR